MQVELQRKIVNGSLKLIDYNILFCQVIRSRLFPNKAATLPVWNTIPGALVTSPQYSRDLKDFPFYDINFKIVGDKFTAVIHTMTSVVRESSALFRLIMKAGQSKFVSKVIKNRVIY